MDQIWRKKNWRHIPYQHGKMGNHSLIDKLMATVYRILDILPMWVLHLMPCWNFLACKWICSLCILLLSAFDCVDNLEGGKYPFVDRMICLYVNTWHILMWNFHLLKLKSEPTILVHRSKMKVTRFWWFSAVQHWRINRQKPLLLQ